jgi:hypothetical protein
MQPTAPLRHALDALPFGRLSYGEPNTISNAIGYAKFFIRSHDAVSRVYDEAGNMTELSPRMLSCGVMWFDEASDPKFPYIAQIMAPCGKWFLGF